MPLSDNARGAALMTAAMFGYTLNDACMKGLSGEVPLMQAIFLRGLGSTLAMVILAAALGQLRPRLAPRDRWLIGWRTLAEAAAAFFFLTALFNMPLSNASAILQSLPLAVSLAAAVFLKEPLGWRRLSAIAIGFVGVLMIVRPGTDGFNSYSMLALATVACVTLRDLTSRQMGASVPSVLVALIASAGVTLAAGVASLWVEWAPLGPESLARLAVATLCLIAGYVFAVSAMRVGDIGAVAPFRYASLIAALLLGVLVFGERPDALTLAGAGVIVATGLFTLWRERKRLKPVPPGLRLR